MLVKGAPDQSYMIMGDTTIIICIVIEENSYVILNVYKNSHENVL